MTSDDLVDLALQSTGMARSEWGHLMELMKVDADMNRLMKAEWFDKPRQSEEAIRDYYSASNIWFVNTFCHGSGALLKMANRGAGASISERLLWHREFTACLTPAGGLRILDYGGGFWNDTWQLAMSGCRVTQAEVKGPVTVFLKNFIEEASLQDYVDVLAVDSETPIVEKYHGITCFETLEHVLKPVELTRHLVEHLESGGPMAMSVSFGAPDHAPYHVSSNAPLSDQGTWFGHLQSMGLSNVWTAEDRHRQIWRKQHA